MIENKKINIIVIKRNGRRVEFDGTKIAVAIKKAFDSVNITNGTKYNVEDVNKIYTAVIKNIEKNNRDKIKIEEIQDLILNILKIENYEDVYKSFDEYRKNREKSRILFEDEKREHKFFAVLEKEKTLFQKNIFNNNNMPKETMINLGSAITKQYSIVYSLKKKISEAHEVGDIYIHDLEYLPMGTTTASMVNLNAVFKNGFSTGIGKYRPPNNIFTYGMLTYILSESLKQEQSGKMGIPYFDTYFAEGIIKTFKKEFKKNLFNYLDFLGVLEFMPTNSIEREIIKIDRLDINLELFYQYFRKSKKMEELVEKSYKNALEETKKLAKKTIEALLHNFNHNSNYLINNENNIKSKIALNIGEDNTKAGMMVFELLLDIIEEGLGNEIPAIEPDIFIAIKKEDLLKLKEYILNGENIYDENIINFNKALNLSCYRENFYFVISNEKNINEIYNAKYIMNHMRIKENIIQDKQNPEGRGIISTTSINLPRIAINTKNEKAFFEELEEKMDLVKLQLFDRFDIQCDTNPNYYSVLYNENVWIDIDKLKTGDRLRKILKNGNLNIGFSGLYEASYILNNKNNEFKKIEKIEEKILKFMKERCEKYSKELNLNFKLYEDFFSGERFIELDKAIFGNIINVTDKEKYNSFYDKNVYKDIKDIIIFKSKMQKYITGGSIISIRKSDLEKEFKINNDNEILNKIDVLLLVSNNNGELVKFINKY